MEIIDYGLVLSGGGGKGSYQIGVWKAFDEQGVSDKISGISGASVGALNTALWGIGDYDLAKSVWDNIKPSEFLNLEYSPAEKNRRGIFTREGLINIMNNKLNLQEVSVSPRKLYANASRMVDGSLESEYFLLNQRSAEEIESILLASSAIPVVYEPVKLGNHWYQDGGLTDNLPIKPLYDSGYRNIIAISLSHAFQIPENQLVFADASVTWIIPSSSLGGLVDGTLDFTQKRVSQRMEMGYQDAIHILADIGS